MIDELFAGAARVLVPGVDDVARFEQPARGEPGRALFVVQPATPGEVREVVRRAVATGTRLIPQGANTGLVGASVPPPDVPTVVLSTDLLRSPPDIDAADATARVLAGTRLSELNEAAAAHGLQLPIDVAADPALGGMIATNTGGSRVMRYGPMRRHVLAAEVVAADEDASVFGGTRALRKDSRGVDAMQLAVGSGGTLGVVTAAVIGLVPLPRSTQTWWLALADSKLAIALLELLDRRRPGVLSAFELVSRPALERAIAAGGAPPSPFGAELPPIAVLAEWSLDHGEVTGVEDDIDAAFDAGLITDGRLLDVTTAWKLRHHVPEALRAAGVVLGHDVSMPRSALMAVRERAIDGVAAIAPDAVMCDFGHAGDGGLHLNVLFPSEIAPPTPEQRAEIRRLIDDLVADAGGSYSAEHGLGPLNAERWLTTSSPLERRLVAAIKDVVDPHRLLGHPGHPYNRVTVT